MFRGMKTHFEKLLKWLAEGGSVSGRRPRSGGPRRFVPQLEGLSERILQANWLWVGPANANWSAVNVWENMQNGALNGNIPPANGDSLFFNPGAPIPPGGTKAPTNNPSFDDIPGLQLNQLSLDASFTADITFQQDLTISANFTDNATGAARLQDAFGQNHQITVNAAGGNATVAIGGGITASLNIDLAKGTTTTISGAMQKTFTTLTNEGAINWTFNGGDISIGTSFTNSGSFNINNTQSLIGAGAFTNSGTVAVNAPAGTMTIATSFTNNGGFELLQGTVNLTGVASQGAGKAPSTTLDRGTTLQASAGGGSYTLNGGSFFADQGTFVGTLINSAGLVSAQGTGGVPSTLTIRGNYNQGIQGTMSVVASWTGNSVINVVAFQGGGGGTATLGGIVQFIPYANNLPGKTPAGGVAFLTYVNRVANFGGWTTTAPGGWRDRFGTLRQFQAPTVNPNGTEYDMNIS
jgi:hypothetical protein